MIKNRPIFSKNMSIKEFEKHYWYFYELKEICKKYELPNIGSKLSLEKNIKLMLSGKKVESYTLLKYKKNKKNNKQELTPETKIIESGFKFDNTAREFFKKYFNLKKITFSKYMVFAVREAYKNNDKNLKVKDLIDIYKKVKIEKTHIVCEEDKTYKWNNFIADFCKDKQSIIFKNKLKVASVLWVYVRDNPGNKIYNTSLIKKYHKEIESFIKK